MAALDLPYAVATAVATQGKNFDVDVTGTAAEFDAILAAAWATVGAAQPPPPRGDAATFFALLTEHRSPRFASTTLGLPNRLADRASTFARFGGPDAVPEAGRADCVLRDRGGAPLA